jgi:Icc-related predicted phosphoesterase
VAKGTLLYFVSDLHGSSLCFRKFVNATQVYKPTVLVLGGDVAGKAIQSIVRGPKGLWQCTFVGQRHELSEGSELAQLERLIADHGYYPYRAEPGELEAMEAEGTLDDLFLRLMRERLSEWLDIADTRLRPKGIPLYLMLGNDDPPDLADLLDQAPWGVHAEGKVVRLDDEHEMISWGYANTTPWHTYREQNEQELAAAYAGLADQLERPERAVFNLHPPPYDTQLDDAPALDENLRVQSTLGQVQYQAVGSTAVREIVAERQPLVGLHGHIHESSGIRRLGKRKGLILNPGSDYSTGALNGALISLQKDRVDAQLVRG